MSTGEAYDAIAGAYEARKLSAQPAPWSEELLRRLVRRLPAGARVLDVGCGPGVELARLRAAGLEAYGVDLSRRVLAAARSRAGGRAAGAARRRARRDADRGRRRRPAHAVGRGPRVRRVRSARRAKAARTALTEPAPDGSGGLCSAAVDVRVRPGLVPGGRAPAPRQVAGSGATTREEVEGLVAETGGEPARTRSVLDEQAAAVLRGTQQFYVALDERGVVQGWNSAATRTFGYEEHEALGVPLEHLIVPEAYRARHLEGIASFVQTGHGRGVDAPVEVRATRKNGAEVPVELTIWAQRTPEGYVFHALGTDLTERRSHERVLRVLAEHRRQLLLLDRPDDVRRLLVETVCSAVDGDGAWLYLCDAAADGPVHQVAATGHAGGEPPRLGAEDEELLLATVARSVCAQVPAAGELVGTASGLSLALEPVVVGEQTTGVLVAGWEAARVALPPSLRDLLALLAAEAVVVLHRLELQEQLLQASRTDPLTGLLNRRAFDEALRAAVSAAERGDEQVTLVLLDLDHFKTYNDRYGHPAGDALLRAVTASWRALVRPPDVLARIGGDEFALLLPHTGSAPVTGVLARLEAATPGSASFSAGVASWTDGDDAGRLMQRADADLYAQKRRRSP